MGETRVDLLHLLEDLRDAYPGLLEETILTEIVANSLDSRATLIATTTDPARAELTIIDDGMGMRRRDLARYHDIAASTKVKGEGIGFAGVGIKLGLLVCKAVLTETRLGKHHVATTWGLVSRHRAPWKWIAPPGLVAERGTAVVLTLQNALSPLLDAGFLETALRRHFLPLLDPGFTGILAVAYPRGVRFAINGQALAGEGRPPGESAPLTVRLARKRKPAADGYLVRSASPVPEERRGLAISTFGKVIKQGWDWLGITPANPERIGGLIEVPALADCLTLNKADFIRAGARGATYLAYRKAIQEVVSRQLALWGDARDTDERARRRAARPAERDLETVVLDLVDRFPLLSSLVERRAGGQRSLAMGSGRDGRAGEVAMAAAPVTPAGGPAPVPSPEGALPAPPADRRDASAAPITPQTPGVNADRSTGLNIPGGRGERRPAHYGLTIQFENRPDDPGMGRLVESTIWVNEAHPAYRRALASRADGYHIALTAAMALASLAVDPAQHQTFVSAFLTSWGAAIDRPSQRRRR